MQIKMSTAATTDEMTVTLECSIQPSAGVAPSTLHYEEVTNDLCSVASWLDTDDICFVNTNVAISYCRIHYVTSNDAGGDCDLRVDVKMLY